MANTAKSSSTAKQSTAKKTVQPKTAEKVENKEVNNTEQELLKQIEELKKQLGQTEQKNVPTVTISKMDRPCTLVHLVDRPEGLETTISVAGKDYSFSSFGEKRTLRYEVMEQLVSKYRDYFRRGIFMLGEDCENSYDEFGIDVTHYPMTVQQYRKMETIPLEEFDKIINLMNMEQRLQLAHTWTLRYSQNKDNYDNLDRLKILNDATNGSLHDFILELTIK